MKIILVLLIIAVMSLVSGCAAKTDAKLIDNKETKVSRNILEINLLTGEIVEKEVSPTQTE